MKKDFLTVAADPQTECCPPRCIPPTVDGLPTGQVNAKGYTAPWGLFQTLSFCAAMILQLLWKTQGTGLSVGVSMVF